ncbi:hypothetical protein [Anoxybacillus suryakundensis]|uniref:Uncharacterized protein n=1 Tax=Anoxybacillus suryakundensis TaxID=1325335 RepID=A0A0K6GN23_9BACL|nr:hypothetical protein Ga0061060_106167 [Anoxybacillus suryakundensis]
MTYRLRGDGGRFGRPVYANEIACLFCIVIYVQFLFTLEEAGVVFRLYMLLFAFLVMEQMGGCT